MVDFWKKTLRKEFKKGMFQSIVQSIGVYGGETWPITETVRNKTRTVELDSVRSFQ